MKKVLLLFIFLVASTAVWSQPPPPPPPPPPSGTGAPIDTDIIILFSAAVLFSVYKLNKARLKHIFTITK